MKKHIPVIATLLLGIALGSGVMLLVLGRGNRPLGGGQEGSGGDHDTTDADQDLIEGFAVTSGAAWLASATLS